MYRRYPYGLGVPSQFEKFILTNRPSGFKRRLNPSPCGLLTGGVRLEDQWMVTHYFESSGQLIVYRPTYVNIAILAGGGGGGTGIAGTCGGGGGGAGGVITKYSILLPIGIYNVVVGTGGASSTGGSNSSFFGFTATGGGKGGNNVAAGNGGCGGGSERVGAGGTGAVNQGYAGDFGYYGGFGGQGTGSQALGGGGGGIGQNGRPYTTGYGGNGGFGIKIPGHLLNRVIGGGGGGGSNGTAAGVGGAGGGGNGGLGGAPGSNGQNGYGAGGGGGSVPGSGSVPGGTGGSGLVMVSYYKQQMLPNYFWNRYSTTQNAWNNSICEVIDNVACPYNMLIHRIEFWPSTQCYGFACGTYHLYSGTNFSMNAGFWYGAAVGATKIELSVNMPIYTGDHIGFSWNPTGGGMYHSGSLDSFWINGNRYLDVGVTRTYNVFVSHSDWLYRVHGYRL